MATIDDFGGPGQPLTNPKLGGPDGWAAAVRDALKILQMGLPDLVFAVEGLAEGAAPTVDTVTEGGVTTVTLGIPDGATGAPGAAPNFTFTAATVAAGQPATVSVTGTYPDLAVALGLPRGATGEKGNPGEKGVPGGSEVYPEAFGAVGDGIADDSAALLAAVATGANVGLTGGATYKVSQQLDLQPGQVLNGNGAVIKRAPQYITTVPGTVGTSGASTLTVADASGFRVGQYVSLGAPGDGTRRFCNYRRITAIAGNTITLHAALNTGVDAYTPTAVTGGTLVTMYAVLQTQDNCRVRDLIIDGNEAAWPHASWEVTQEILQVGDGTIIDGCTIRNAPAEGVYATTATGGQKITNCSFINIGGNGVHLSATKAPIIADCDFRQTNMRAGQIGHEDGAVSWSRLAPDTVVEHCTFDDVKAAGGAFFYSDDAGVTFSGCVIRNARDYAFKAFEAAASGGRKQGNAWTITNNRIYDCAPTTFGLSVAPPANIADWTRGLILADNQWHNSAVRVMSMADVIISDNVFLDSPVNLLNVRQTRVSGNAFRMTKLATAFETGGDALLRAQNGCEGLTISGNAFRDCQRSAYYETSGTVRTTFVGNNVKDCESGSDVHTAVHFYSSTSPVIVGNTMSGGRAGIYCSPDTTAPIIAHNRITGVVGRVCGIFIPPGTIVEGNSLSGWGAESNAGGTGVNAASDCIITDNIILDPHSTSGQVVGVMAVNAVGTVIANNIIRDTRGGAATMVAGIYALGASTSRLRVAGNHVSGSTGNPIQLGGPAGSTQTAPAVTLPAQTIGTTVVAIPHNLGYIPLGTWITMKSAGTVWVAAAATNTHLYLQADAAGRVCDVAVG